MSQASVAIAYARAQIGKWYQFGATGPDTFDCSGLTVKAYEAAGVKIGRTTYQQIFNGRSVSKSELRPGDLVFPDPDHVSLYVGGGTVIEAPHTGAQVREVPMWGFWAARRVVTDNVVLAVDPIDPFTDPFGNSNPNNGMLDPMNPYSYITELQGQVKSLLTLATDVNRIALWLADPKNWWRLSVFLFGVMLLWLGVQWVTGNLQRSVNAGKAVVNAAT